ncbi:MAG: hypothetical protein ABJA79_05920 [Parafilimonas sp.]
MSFFRKLLMFGFAICFLNFPLKAQNTQKDTSFKPSGKLWGLAFGDFYYKAHTDTLNRGGANQYTGVPKNKNAFQLRRIYLGYSYDISKKFSADMVLAAEDNTVQTIGGTTTTSGDLLTDNKLAFYVKQANIRWKNLWSGTDLVVGQVQSPAFAFSSEPVWNYRSVERTLLDVRRTPSTDFGAELQGKFDPTTGNFGYNVMLANGTGAKPENDNFKWFYGDVYAKFFDKKIMVDLYADYERLNWVSNWHHSRSMIKGFVAYTTPELTIGVEGFIHTLKQDNFATVVSTSAVDTIDAKAKAISVFVHGQIVKDKLRFFARYDAFNPDDNLDNGKYSAYKGNTTAYTDLSTKEQFITAGLDFTPSKNVHFMPNVWYNKYTNQGPKPLYNSYDLVYRITFYYVYGR